MFVIFAIRTSADWRTFTVHLFASTVVICAIFAAITAFQVYLIAFNDDILFFKSLLVNGFSFFDNKFSSFRKLFGVKTVNALALRTAITEIFKAGTM